MKPKFKLTTEVSKKKLKVKASASSRRPLSQAEKVEEGIFQKLKLLQAQGDSLEVEAEEDLKLDLNLKSKKEPFK
ncbi:unnamed protein product [Caenorhabditis auriculariae]|uniref:Uncharacterized protein n=1 Tax=Caenorhabditis auriculariae TaxID=2777116 RepID=A0A8S1GRV5_9PELO|nr:unnamed protein product [Caenorhabditis auriculariae]